KKNRVNSWEFYEAAIDEVDEAAQLASKAFETYRNFSGQRKAEFLIAIAEEIENLGDELLETFVTESGLPKGRAEGERGRTIFQLRSMAELLMEGSWVEAIIDTAVPDRKPIPKPDLRKMLIPIGPIVVFGSSNFPLAYSTAGGDTATAFAAGCPVIVKSHPMHAATGELVASAIVKAAMRTEMPDGVFSNLNSGGIEVGQQLVSHPSIKGVGFTGSIAGGTALYRLAAGREEPIPVFAEMGSINPVIILPSALKKETGRWAQAYAESITLGTGQFCTNPGLILGFKSPSLNNFIAALGDQLLKTKPGLMLHPRIYENYEHGKEMLSDEEGISVIADYNKKVDANYAQQLLLSVEGKFFKHNPRLHKEVFGPFSMVVQCDNRTEMRRILKRMEGQLTGTVLGDPKEMKEYADVLEALRGRVGRIIHNGVPTGVEVCPAMQHGGPFPASTDARFGAVGASAIRRWVRPVSYQDWPLDLLPDALKDKNPLGILRMVNGSYSNSPIY
ncbi:MAG: aldehyde dehydrogenase (NADP(+)), partial [Flavobacteriaceae bacterium]